MRKSIFLVLFILCVTLTQNIKAQTTRDSDFRFSFVLSPQISWMSSDNSKVDSKGSLSGYNFGVVMDKFFAPNYAISTGISINTTGGKLQYAEGGAFDIGGETTILEPNDVLKYRLKYLEIPLCLKLQTNDQQRTSFYGVFGVSGNVNIKATDEDRKKLNDEVRNLFFGYEIGGGVQYALGGTTYLTAGLHYKQGLSDITKNANVDDRTTLNRLVIQLGIIF